MNIFQELFIFTQLCLLCYGFDLTLLHVNDIHSRFEETDKYSGVCEDKNRNEGKCYGGVARLYETVQNIYKEQENVIFVNGGDFYQGTLWYTKFKWEVVAKFGNILNFTAMAPGNHEFDDGIEGLEPFLKKVTFPIVCANCDLSDLPELKNFISPSITVELNGHKIGIIGFILPEVTDISYPGKMKFKDEVESINVEAQKLTDQGVKIIIAVGHSGFTVDKKIAKDCPNVDVVVGGHSNTFLYNGDVTLLKPEKDYLDGDYPYMVGNVPVVQAYAYTKYLGNLSLTFDEEGKLQKWDGQPILLTQSMPQNQLILQELEPYKQKLEEWKSETIGHTDVLLKNSRNEESNFGNLFTDSMVFRWHQKKNICPIGILNSGAIRRSLAKGPLTMADIFGALPFANSIDLFKLKGVNLRKMLSYSADLLRSPDGFYTGGAFLQVSGIKMAIDLTKPEGSRLTSLKVRTNCDGPSKNEIYEELNDEKLYSITTMTYLSSGKDGYDILKTAKINYTTGDLDTDVLMDYLELKNPVTQLAENRIIVTQSSTSSVTSQGSIFKISFGFVLVNPIFIDTILLLYQLT